MKIVTIGYEGATADDFVATVLAEGIEVLIDIRDVAVSRRPGFSKTSLSQILTKHGIEYVHLKYLGDPKPGREAARAGNYKEFIDIYSKHLATEEAQSALRQAEAIVREKRSCLLCYEREPRHCHRLMVAESLSIKLDMPIKHLGVRQGLAKGAGISWTRTSLSARQSAASGK